MRVEVSSSSYKDSVPRVKTRGMETAKQKMLYHVWFSTKRSEMDGLDYRTLKGAA